ncbi:hypothetical protein GOP47_0025867 [Adiantum capillus-veneris]|uniref:Uncharacterized protein n=1 Tax=Adiantum capillus-veneris TaxID=13818 RepID=A0A9D4U1A0_ADICA|nr:hypothetical protein GOP47_0025867 [Adiantum capillus-veneris]
MQAQIAPLQTVVMKPFKVLRRMCVEAAKAKVVELAKAIDCELQGFLDIKYLDPHIRKSSADEDSITGESLIATVLLAFVVLLSAHVPLSTAVVLEFVVLLSACELWRPAFPLPLFFPAMLQLMPSGRVGRMSLREWCEAGYYLLCRFDPNIKGCGFLWEKNLAEEKNWKTSFDGLLKAEKERVTPSLVVTPPAATPCQAPFVVDNECKDYLVLTTRVSELEAQVQTIAQMQARIAPLQAVVMKHNKALNRMCLDAAKAKVVELVDVQPGYQPWCSYLKYPPQESISLIQPSLSKKRGIS